MKAPIRDHFPGYREVPSFPYMWAFALGGPFVVMAAGIATYGLLKGTAENPRMGYSLLATIITGAVLLIFQHGFARFRCKQCRKAMVKYRHSEKTTIFHYACDDCRIFWSNFATSPGGKHQPPRVDEEP